MSLLLLFGQTYSSKSLFASITLSFFLTFFLPVNLVIPKPSHSRFHPINVCDVSVCDFSTSVVETVAIK